MSLRRGGLNGVIVVLWRALRNNGRAPMRTLIHCCEANVTEQRLCQPEWANGNFSDTSPEWLHSQSVGCVMCPRDAADLEWPLSEGMQVSALPPVWIAMIISCWSIKLLTLPSVTLEHVCSTNSHNWWAKGLPGVGVDKIFSGSDSSGWKSFRLRLHDSDSTALVSTLRSKGPQTTILLYRYYAFEGPPTATLMCK